LNSRSDIVESLHIANTPADFATCGTPDLISKGWNLTTFSGICNAVAVSGIAVGEGVKVTAGSTVFRMAVFVELWLVEVEMPGTELQLSRSMSTTKKVI